MARFCTKCGKEIEEWAAVCPHCGAQTADNKTSLEEDKASAGFIVLSIFIPIAGIILWAVKHNETPKAAKTYLLIGVIIIAITFLSYGCSAAMLGSMYY